MAEIFGALVLAGFGLIHLGLGLVLLATGYRTLRRELIPRLAEARPGPASAALTVVGGLGWIIVVAIFCFLIAGRAAQMIF